MAAEVENLELKLFDYGLHNDGPLEATLEQGILRIGRFKLTGEDVALATTPPSGLSMQNRLRGRIRRFVSQGNSVLCLIDARPNLIAEISPHAVRQLRLEEGSPVYCLFKAFALRYLDR